ncbi:MAG: sodium:solute symporter [Opitutaceae bacterium]|jgi:SSS family transporter|nr:sodium:solute symporter [Opitutaceae bacterium]
MTPVFAAVHARTLAWQDYIALILYFVVILGIGWWCSRRKQSAANDYFLGGGRIPWWAAAVSFFATATSGISFMALPAKSFDTNWLAYGTVPAQTLGGFVLGFVFVGLLRRMNMATIFSYLERRFDKRVQLLGAGLGIMLKIGGRMSVIMLLPALALSTVTGLNVYVSILLMGIVTTIYAVEGGFEAVIWTDFLQAIVVFGGIFISIYYLAGGVEGGLAGIFKAGGAAGKFHAIDWSFNFTESTVWVFSGMFAATIFTYLGDQPLMQRMLAMPTDREARNTVVIGCVIGTVSATLFFFIGSALWVFYNAHPERLAEGLPNDAIFPFFIANELPRGIVGLIVAALFAVSMGALSGIINSAAAIVVSDFQMTIKPGSTEKQRIRVARLTTLLCGLLATVFAMYLAAQNARSLWDVFIKLVALIGGGFPGVFALGMLTRRANAPGVIIGAVASIGVTWWVQNYTTANVFFHGFVAIVSCMVVGYVASLFFPAPARTREEMAGMILWKTK